MNSLPTGAFVIRFACDNLSMKKCAPSDFTARMNLAVLLGNLS